MCLINNMSSIDNSLEGGGSASASGKKGVIQLSDGNFNLTSNKDLKSDPATGTITTTGLTTTGDAIASFFLGDGGLLSNVSGGGSTPTLQEVTTQGATTTDTVSVGGLTSSAPVNVTGTISSSSTVTGTNLVVSGTAQGLNLTSTGTLSAAGITSSDHVIITGADKSLTASNVSTSNLTVSNRLSGGTISVSNLEATANLVVGGPADITGTLSAAGITSSADTTVTGTLTASANVASGGNVVATNFFFGDGGLLSNVSGGGGGTPTLQQVTTQGATTTDSITIGGLTTSNITSVFNTLTATTDVTMVQASGGGTLTIGVQDAATYENHSGFVDADGNLWMTGANNYGQCGDALNSIQGVHYRIVATGVSNVVCGELLTFFIKTDGSLWGMGRNLGSKLGVSGSFFTTPTQLVSSSPSKVIKVVTGEENSMLIKEDGSIWGCGRGAFIDSSSYYATWERLSISGSPASGIDVAAGIGGFRGYRTFIIDTNNDLYGCGEGDNNGFGNGSTADLTAYTSLTTGVTQVSCDSYATTALVSDGSLLNAGTFRYGSYGDGNITVTVTTWTASTLTGKSITSISHGEERRIVKDSNSDIYGTGRNSSGELGVSTPTTITSWTLVAQDVSKHECGVDSSYYIDSSNDKLYLGGQNAGLGYLGFGTVTYAVKPWTVNPATYTAYTGNSLTAVDIDVTGTLSTGSLTTSAIMTGGNFVGDTITSNISLTANATITGTLSTNYISIDTATSSNLSISSNLEVGTSNLFVNTATGNVGIGIINPEYELHVIGNIYATGDITALSDKRHKEDLLVIDSALDKVKRLTGYTYTLHGNRSAGLLAQDVLEVLPEVVKGSEDTNYSLAYGNLTGLTIEAIKELDKRVDRILEKHGPS
jgi:alpha-tubulin suppressor-like RCC1 family protein